MSNSRSSDSDLVEKLCAKIMEHVDSVLKESKDWKSATELQQVKHRGALGGIVVMQVKQVVAVSQKKADQFRDSSDEQYNQELVRVANSMYDLGSKKCLFSLVHKYAQWIVANLNLVSSVTQQTVSTLAESVQALSVSQCNHKQQSKILQLEREMESLVKEWESWAYYGSFLEFYK